MRRVPTVYITGMPVRLTEIESNIIGLIIYRYYMLQSVKLSVVVDVVFLGSTP